MAFSSTETDDRRVKDSKLVHFSDGTTKVTIPKDHLKLFAEAMKLPFEDIWVKTKVKITYSQGKINVSIIPFKPPIESEL